MCVTAHTTLLHFHQTNKPLLENQTHFFIISTFSIFFLKQIKTTISPHPADISFPSAPVIHNSTVPDCRMRVPRLRNSSTSTAQSWRFVPDAILPGHRRAHWWVPARTPTVHQCGSTALHGDTTQGCKTTLVSTLGSGATSPTHDNSARPLQLHATNDVHTDPKKIEAQPNSFVKINGVHVGEEPENPLQLDKATYDKTLQQTPTVQQVRKTVEVPQVQFDNVLDAPRWICRCEESQQQSLGGGRRPGSRSGTCEARSFTFTVRLPGKDDVVNARNQRHTNSGATVTPTLRPPARACQSRMAT